MKMYIKIDPIRASREDMLNNIRQFGNPVRLNMYGRPDPAVKAPKRIPIANPRFLLNQEDINFIEVGYTPAKKKPVINRKVVKNMKFGESAARRFPNAAKNAFKLKNNGVFTKSGKLKTE